ncbi:MAG: hypothetical protein WKG07_20990 [Hymenobacter sp.]
MRKGFHHEGLVDLGGVLSSLVFGLIVAASVLVASVIIFPSVKPATIISSLGIGPVAIRFRVQGYPSEPARGHIAADQPALQAW